MCKTTLLIIIYILINKSLGGELTQNESALSKNTTIKYVYLVVKGKNYIVDVTEVERLLKKSLYYSNKIPEGMLTAPKRPVIGFIYVWYKPKNSWDLKKATFAIDAQYGLANYKYKDGSRVDIRKSIKNHTTRQKN